MNAGHCQMQHVAWTRSRRMHCLFASLSVSDVSTGFRFHRAQLHFLTHPSAVHTASHGTLPDPDWVIARKTGASSMLASVLPAFLCWIWRSPRLSAYQACQKTPVQGSQCGRLMVSSPQSCLPSLT